MGSLAYREEAAADVIIYVEDEAAQILVENFVFRYVQQVYADNQIAPSLQVVPVGGMTNVLRFFVRQRPLLPAVTRCYIMLDADAEDILNEAQAPDIVKIRDNEHASISYLPVTPEVGLAEYLHGNIKSVQDSLRIHYRLRLTLLRRDLDPLPRQRDSGMCKKLVEHACEKISEQLPNVGAGEVKITLLKLYADSLFANDRAAIMRLMGPLVQG